MKFVLLAVFILFFMLTACQPNQQTPSSTIQHEQQEMMFNSDFWSITEKIYTPTDWPEPLVAEVIHPAPHLDNLPIMLLVHGGGWQRRSLKDMQPVARYWANRGFITVNVAYRFAPDYQFPAQLNDLQHAMHWIHTQRTDWKAQSSPVIAFGFSSGAHLVSLMANVAGYTPSLDLPHGGIITRPDVVILGGIPSDLQKWNSGRLIEDFLGGTRKQRADTYRIASPISHVHAKTPPTFIFHGKLDRLVPIDHATDYYQALQNADVDTKLHTLALRGHMTSFIFRGSAMRAAEEFINIHLNNSSDNQHIRSK